MVKSQRTTAGLRDVLFTELQELRQGKSTPSRARAICSICSHVLKTVELEIKAQKLKQRKITSLAL